jgi:glycosyltransferase involved in cell wall biosynthesis
VAGDAPLVTLAMPVWQPREDWLRRSVDDALAQRDCAFELLVVDDGSEPGVEMLPAFRAGDPRVRVVRIPHGGLARARNAAVAEARGAYLRFLDYDDAYPPDGTARLLALAAGRQDVIACGASLVCDAELRPVWRMTPRHQGDVTVDSLLARFNVRAGGGMLWPRRVLELAGGFDPALTVAEDWDFIQRALEHGTVRSDPAVVHLYRRHDAAATTNYEAGRAAARTIVARYFERHPERRGTRLERRALAMLDATSARVYATHGQPRRAFVHAVRALRRDPLAFGNELYQAVAAVRGRAATRLRRR